MAEPAKKGGLAIVIGAPKKPMGGSEDYHDAREMLKDASGWDDDVLDALHEYIAACREETETEAEPDGDEGMG